MNNAEKRLNDYVNKKDSAINNYLSLANQAKEERLQGQRILDNFYSLKQNIEKPVWIHTDKISSPVTDPTAGRNSPDLDPVYSKLSELLRISKDKGYSGKRVKDFLLSIERREMNQRTYECLENTSIQRLFLELIII